MATSVTVPAKSGQAVSRLLRDAICLVREIRLSSVEVLRLSTFTSWAIYPHLPPLWRVMELGIRSAVMAGRQGPLAGLALVSMALRPWKSAYLFARPETIPLLQCRMVVVTAQMASQVLRLPPLGAFCLVTATTASSAEMNTISTGTKILPSTSSVIPPP